MTTEQAGDFALRYVSDDVEELTQAERERLFAWVRDRMDDPAWSSLSVDPEAREQFAAELAETLDIMQWESMDDDCDADYTHAWAICEAVGWPS